MLSTVRIGRMPPLVSRLGARSHALQPGVIWLDAGDHARLHTPSLHHTLAHELFHQYQRLCGLPVAAGGAAEQVVYTVWRASDGAYGRDVYAYASAEHGAGMVGRLLGAGIEAQAQLFADAVEAAERGRAGAYADVLAHVRADGSLRGDTAPTGSPEQIA